MSDTSANANGETTAPAETAPADVESIRLPDGHPLLKTLAAQKEEIKQIREEFGAPADFAKIRAKAKRLDELEEANKTEQQKLTDAADTARKEAAETAVELAKLRAAVKHGLTDDDLELLGTGTAEEIESRAERLAARLKGNPTPAAPSSDGQGKQGAPLDGVKKQITTLEELNKLTPEEVNKARREGLLDGLLGKS